MAHLSFVAIVAPLAAFTVFARLAPAVLADEPPVTVFVAKKIITMDPGWPTATAVAVQGGKVLSVGSLDDLNPWLHGRRHTIDRTFADKVLVPGLIEAHGHPIIGGTALTRPLLTFLPTPSPYGPPFPGVKTPDEALARLRGYVAQAKTPSATVLAWGYDVIAMGGRHLDKTILDKVSASQPILVWDASEHFVYANSAALRKYKVTPEDTKRNGVMAGPDGAPDGRFLGTTAAQRILQEPLAELLAPEVALRNIRFLMDLSRQHGITTTSEMAFGAINLDLEKGLFETFFNGPNSPVRCVVVTDGTTIKETKGDGSIAFVQDLARRSSDTLVFRGIKFFSDDAFLSLGMMIENPGYVDGRKGLFITPPDTMVETWLPWWRAGFQIHVHTNGNAGNQATIDALDGLMKAHPRTDHRFTLQHYGISTPEQARRIKALGGVVSVNPFYLYHRSEFNAPYIGADRAYTAARLKTLVDAGVPTALHSDTPVAPPDPLAEVWIAVNRVGLSGRVRGPAERISLPQALRMVTIDAAYTLGVEDKVGSIAAGKFADFAVLEQDPFEVRTEVIREIKVWGTVLGGKVLPASGIRPPS
ncbi:MAG: amidohydrolase family protein [Isosphaeraceae bacterium]|nr:amidohydrolase family protein [Isosphaeraceae bacterium]